jgi:hypothetical protein
MARSCNGAVRHDSSPHFASPFVTPKRPVGNNLFGAAGEAVISRDDNPVAPGTRLRTLEGRYGQKEDAFSGIECQHA